MKGIKYYIANYCGNIVAMSPDKDILSHFLTKVHQFYSEDFIISATYLSEEASIEYMDYIISEKKKKYSTLIDDILAAELVDDYYEDLCSNIENIKSFCADVSDINKDDAKRIFDSLLVITMYLFTKPNIGSSNSIPNLSQEYEKKTSELYKLVFKKAYKEVRHYSIEEYIMRIEKRKELDYLKQRYREKVELDD